VGILIKFNFAPPPSSPSKGGVNKVFSPQEGDLMGSKVLFGASVRFPPLEELKMRCFPLWRGTKGEESFVSGEHFGFPPLEGLKMSCFPLWRGTGGRKFLFGTSVGFPPLEGDKGGGFFLYKEEKIVINPKLLSCNPIYYLRQSFHLNFTGILFNIVRITGNLTCSLKFYI
jgi:hypothetical protein